MNENLASESRRLSGSWMQHEAGWLRDYLVAGVEDPRINLQSILSRHFLIRALTGNRLEALMQQEYRFAAVMNWFFERVVEAGTAEECATILDSLRRDADNAEGVEIPHFVTQTFRALPASANGVPIPNYLETFLTGSQLADGQVKPREPCLNTFGYLWNLALAAEAQPTEAPSKSIPHADADQAAEKDKIRLPLSLVEVACGSANDYRFLRSYGIARLVDYAGIDLCPKNINNARALFPDTRFECGNVFELPVADKTFDFCMVHDLFEHLSLEGMETAVKEVCRVTRQSLCLGFFQMDEIPEHIVRPRDDYYWNLLSLDRMRQLFAHYSFAAQAVHIGTFLRQQLGCLETHNPQAYSLFLRAV